jgi:hypothetical protein
VAAGEGPADLWVAGRFGPYTFRIEGHASLCVSLFPVAVRQDLRMAPRRYLNPDLLFLSAPNAAAPSFRSGESWEGYGAADLEARPAGTT